MLKITKSSDSITVSQLIVVLYGPPGCGKTSTGFTAASPLLLDFDGGAYRSKNRGDSVQVSAWSDVASIKAGDLTDYKTVVVDTAGRALDALTADVISANPKMGRGGALTLQGYGELKAKFIAWTKLIRSFGLDVVLLAHSDEQRQGDEIIERLDVQGGSKNEIYKVADVMGRIGLSNGQRMLNFSPTDTAFGKNPAQLPPLEIPNFAAHPHFLGEVIAQVKGELNAQSEEQIKAASLLADWSAKLDECQTVEQFNDILPKARAADKLVRDALKFAISAAAKKADLKYDKDKDMFVAVVKEKEKAAA